MIAAAETARRNPMRPPDSLPRSRRDAVALFLRHPSPRLIALALTLAAGARLWLGAVGWIDLAAALGVWAWFPVNEWLIHVFVLHYRPRRLFGRTLDFYLPVTHRRHHAAPWDLRWVFIPRHVHLWVFPLLAVLVGAAGSWRGLVLSGVAMYLMLGLHYEWVHYLAHIPWCPESGYYQRRVREHRYHHFRNEHYWWGVSMGLGDRLFGTAPAAQDIARSGTTDTLGRK
jgi:hypothetical protein